MGATWGSLYLIQIQSLNALQASFVTSMIYIGTIIGGPLAGAISDRWQRRRLPMIIGGILTFIAYLPLFMSDLTLMQLMLIFLCLGLFSSTQVIAYPTVPKVTPKRYPQPQLVRYQFSCIGGGAIFPYLFGNVMDWHWND